MYYLIDLERSILSGNVFYLKQNKHGYTRDVFEAGMFPEEMADEIVKEDFDKRTVMVTEETVRKLFKFIGGTDED